MGKTQIISVNFNSDGRVAYRWKGHRKAILKTPFDTELNIPTWIQGCLDYPSSASSGDWLLGGWQERDRSVKEHQM